jgi:hypothetical protein
MYALADCNNFFASCERVFRPELNGRPVIVLSNNDGCAVARSNEAKAFGRGEVLLGSQGSGEIKMSREHQSPHYTTLWSDIPKTSVR